MKIPVNVIYLCYTLTNEIDQSVLIYLSVVLVDTKETIVPYFTVLIKYF